MNKILFAFFATLFVYQTSFSQSNIAELKYGDAEIAFEKEDFATTLTKLDEAEKLLGKSNAKLLYLRLQAQNGIIQKERNFEYSLVESTKANAKTYLTKYVNADKTKFKDIYELSEALNKKYKNKEAYLLEMEARTQAENRVRDEENRKKAIRTNMANQAKKYKFATGKTLAEYANQYPEFKEFISKSKVTESNGQKTYMSKLGLRALGKSPFRVGIEAIVTKNDRVTIIMHVLATGNKNETGKLYDQYESLKAEAIDLFGKDNVSSGEEYGTVVTTVKAPGSGFFYKIKYMPPSVGLNACTLFIDFYGEEQ